MKDERFPWTQVGPGPVPRLPSDFAARAIEKARTTRARRRRVTLGIGAAAGFAAVVAFALLTRATPANLPASGGIASSQEVSGLDTVAWSNDSDTDVLAVLMPNARQAEKFDAYYGAAAWDTYASWNPDSYDSSRTR